MQSRIIDIKELVKNNPVLQTIDLTLCVSCKSVKSLCGHVKCPLLDALNVYPDPENYRTIKSNTIFGPSEQIFVGSQGYPRVNTGPLTSILEDPELLRISGNPAAWREMSLQNIIDLRYGLIRGKKNVYIQPSKSDRLIDQLQQLSMSTESVDIEGLYSNIPRNTSSFSIETQPMGPSANLQRLDIAGNPKIPKVVDYVLGDELKAADQMFSLYNNNFDVYYLQKIFSAGLTGLENQKKIVPTRWSITGTDDTIGKQLIPQLRDMIWVNDIEIHFATFLGNEYTIILMPGIWSFENFETWMAGGIFTLNAQWQSSYCHEGFSMKEYYRGRSSYASQAGGYYATRLAVLEHLTSRKIQARVIVIREITPNYVIPVGVWQVREGVRMALENKLANVSKKDELSEILDYLNLPAKSYFHKSQTFTQTSLDDFF